MSVFSENKLPGKNSEISGQESNQKITNWEMKALEGPMANVLEGMRGDIEKGNYGMIIGDDASGRVPALLMGEIFSKLYKDSRNKAPETKFLALYPTGKRDEAWSSLNSNRSEGIHTEILPEDKIRLAKKKISQEFTSRLDKEKLRDKKILIVTDIIATGGSIKPLIESLVENGIKVDVLTLYAFGDDKMTTKIKDMGAGNFYDLNRGVMYKKEELSGVRKDEHKYNLRALPAKTFFDRVEDKTDIQQKINLARVDIKILADKLVDGFINKAE